jgi:acyl-CoA hydrolase
MRVLIARWNWIVLVLGAGGDTHMTLFCVVMRLRCRESRASNAVRESWQVHACSMRMFFVARDESKRPGNPAGCLCALPAKPLFFPVDAVVRARCHARVWREV